MSKSIFFIAVLLLTSTGRMMGQNVSDLPANSYPFNLSGQSIMTFDERYKDVIGYPTYFEKFVSGTVRLRTGQVYKNVLVNYDCVTDNLISKSAASNAPMLVRKDLVESFSVPVTGPAEVIHFVNGKIKDVPVFLWVLVSDSIPLFCKITKVIKGGDFSGAYNTSEYKSREFVKEYKFYVELTVGATMELPGKKKSFIKLFPRIQENLEAYFRSNRVDFSNPEDMRLLLIYVNDSLKGRAISE